MKRETKFRGICVDNGEWVYGYYQKYLSSHYIWNEVITPATWSDPSGEYQTENFEVIPETVGEYTGLKDKTGKDIFEGDVVRFTDERSFYNESALYKVIFRDCQFLASYPDGSDGMVLFQELGEWEIVGNVHQYPHLLP